MGDRIFACHGCETEVFVEREGFGGRSYVQKIEEGVCVRCQGLDEPPPRPEPTVIGMHVETPEPPGPGVVSVRIDIAAAQAGQRLAREGTEQDFARSGKPVAALRPFLPQPPHHPVSFPKADLLESREQAAFPAKDLHEYKHWPHVSRVDNVFGDRNPVCSCVGMEDYS